MASTDIVLSAALRNNLLSLQNTQRNIDTVQLRLATGLKVNSALDNPQNFFTAQSLNNRAGDLTRLLDGIGLSIQTIQEADKGVTSLTDLVEQAQSVAESAKAEALSATGFAVLRSTVDLRSLGTLADGVNIINGTSDQFRLTVVQSDGTHDNIDVDISATSNVDDVVAQINTNATNVTKGLVQASVSSSGKLEIKSLKDGAALRITTTGAQAITAAGYGRLGLDNLVGTEQSGAATTRQSGTAITGRIVKSDVSGAGTVTVNGQDVYQSSAVLGSAGANFINGYGSAGTDDLTISLVVDGTTTAIGNYTDTNTIQDLVDDVNAADLGVTASFNTDTGQIELKAGNEIGNVAIQFSHNDGTSTGNVAFGFGAGAVGYGGATGGNAVTLAAGATQAQSERITFVGTSANLAQYEDDFDSIREQIDNLVEDANFRGVNLLDGDDLTTFFNEDRSNSLVTEGVDFTASGLGLNQADFSNTTGVQKSLDATLSALDTVRNFGQSIANDLSILQNRQDFTQNTVNVLKAGAESLTVADQNEEGANLLALQTRQQLGVTSLALAAQSQQSVLRLF